jgi:hypothetical protein
MLAWIRGWLIRMGLFRAPPQVGAASAMAELRARKQTPAIAEDWKTLVARFRTQVFSEEDRKRLWRRYRRKYGGDLTELEDLIQPTTQDQACLKQILDELAR